MIEVEIRLSSFKKALKKFLTLLKPFENAITQCQICINDNAYSFQYADSVKPDIDAWITLMYPTVIEKDFSCFFEHSLVHVKVTLLHEKEEYVLVMKRYPNYDQIKQFEAISFQGITLPARETIERPQYPMYQGFQVELSIKMKHDMLRLYSWDKFLGLLLTTCGEEDESHAIVDHILNPAKRHRLITAYKKSQKYLTPPYTELHEKLSQQGLNYDHTN